MIWPLVMHRIDGLCFMQLKLHWHMVAVLGFSKNEAWEVFVEILQRNVLTIFNLCFVLFCSMEWELSDSSVPSSVRPHASMTFAER
jgi:hypothetical protein